MCQGGRLGNIWIDPSQGLSYIGLLTGQSIRERTRDLRDFEGMCEPVVKDVDFIRPDDLCDFG